MSAKIVVFIRFDAIITENLSIFKKFHEKVLVVSEKVVPLHPQIGTRLFYLQKGIGVWCNGNTADSGPAFPGSSPGTPTEEIPKSQQTKGFRFFLTPPLDLGRLACQELLTPQLLTPQLLNYCCLT